MTKEEVLKQNVELYFSSDHDGEEDGAEWHTANATAESIYKSMDQYAGDDAVKKELWNQLHSKGVEAREYLESIGSKVSPY